MMKDVSTRKDDLQTPLLAPAAMPDEQELMPASKTEVPCCRSELELLLEEHPLPAGISITHEELAKILQEEPFLWWGLGVYEENAAQLWWMVLTLSFLTMSLGLSMVGLPYVWVPILVASASLIAFTRSFLNRASTKYSRVSPDAVVQTKTKPANKEHQHDNEEGGISENEAMDQDRNSTSHDERATKSVGHCACHTLLEIVLICVVFYCCGVYHDVTGTMVVDALVRLRASVRGQILLVGKTTHEENEDSVTTWYQWVLVALLQVTFVLVRILLLYFRAFVGAAVFFKHYVPLQAISYSMHKRVEFPSLRNVGFLVLHSVPCMVGFASGTFELLDLAGKELYTSLFGFPLIIGAVVSVVIAVRLFCPVDRLSVLLFANSCKTKGQEGLDQEAPNRGSYQRD